MPVSNQSETIDPRILRLIGLEDVFDLDYETYLTLLKEVMVKSRMTKTVIPTEEIELLTEEYKRVKNKKDAGRFEVKRKTITAKAFVTGGRPTTGTKALPGTAIGKSPVAKSFDDSISIITSTVISIADTLKQQQNLEKEKSAFGRRQSEKERRALAESNLEKRFDGLKKAAEKIIAPVKGILSKIFDFLTKIFFGRILYKLIEWFGDPKNADKIKSLIRFTKDWWPALLGAYILFGTSFGRFTRRIVSTVGKFIFEFGKKAIPSLMRFAAANPVTSALVLGGTLAAGGAYLASQQNEQKREGVKPGEGTPGPAQLQREQTLQRGLGGMFSGGGLARKFFNSATGGRVSGKKGVDKVPAMLTDGEFVMSRGAVNKYGVDTLEAMNAAGGGTNRPRMVQGAAFAEGGGLIGNKPKPSETIREQKEAAKTPNAAKQAQMALSSGRGLALKGESIGRNLGMGYGAKYQGRDALVVKGGGANVDLSVTIAGKRYYGMKRGNDAVYVSLDARNMGTGGLFQPGGLLGGPRTSARMDYAQSKGKYYSSSDQKTYANYNDAKAARQSRMTSLESQQRLNRLSSVGANRSSRGVRFEAESKAANEDFVKRGGIFGQIGRGLTSMFGTYKDINKNTAADKASTTRVKQAGAQSIGRYYSSSDGKYYKDYNAAVKARKLRLAEQKKNVPVIKPPVKPRPGGTGYNAAGGGMNGGRGSSSASGTTIPNFRASSGPSSHKKQVLGVK
jgi:hypothetical protein